MSSRLKNMILLLGLLFSMQQLYAQPATNVVGIRAGYSSGFTYKYFLDKEAAIEGLALYNSKGFQGTVLYEYQFTPYAKKRLYYYFGGGLYAGDWNDDMGAGIALMAGGAFYFRAAPISLGLDWKPMLNLYRDFDYLVQDIALTFRVVLN